MITRFQVIPPHPLLKDYIERIFIIESSGRLPDNDLKLIVPNGCPKLVIPFKNGLTARSAEWEHLSKENKITFIGCADIPASVDFQQEGPAGNITIEFSPQGAYRFIDIDWREVKNSIYDYSDMMQKTVLKLEERLVNTTDLQMKLRIIHQFLFKKFNQHLPDPVFDYCAARIIQAKGKVSMAGLEKQTGYSARWINMRFQQRIGLSPGNLASIIRFQQYYHSLVMNTEQFFFEKKFYDYYYDQSHFIRDFKRFTGHPPLLFSQISNKYDKVFYRE